MTDVDKPLKNTKDAQTAAVLASAVIAGGFLLYWAIQIQSVRELLALAYGDNGHRAFGFS